MTCEIPLYRCANTLRASIVEGATLEVIEDDLAQAQVRIVVLLDGDVITQFECDISEHLVRPAASRFDDREDVLPQRIPKERLDAGAGYHDGLPEQKVEPAVHGERFGYPGRGPCQHRHTIVTGMLNDGVSWDLPVRTDRQTQVFAEFGSAEAMKELIQLDETLGDGKVLMKEGEGFHSRLLQNDACPLGQ